MELIKEIKNKTSKCNSLGFGDMRLKNSVHLGIYPLTIPENTITADIFLYVNKPTRIRYNFELGQEVGHNVQVGKIRNINA